MLKKIVKTAATGLLAVIVAAGFIALLIGAAIQQQERSAAQLYRNAQRLGE